MKRSLILISSTILASLLMVSGVAAKAQVLAENTESSNTETTDDSTQMSMQERLDKHKTDLKIRLTNLEQTHIKDKCKMAQTGGIKSLGGRIHGIETSRGHVYDNLLNRLNKLVDKLKAKGIDTSSLDSEIAVLKTKITTFKTDLAIYKQDISDLKDMDCSSDPTAFKSALEAARTQRQKLVQDGVDIKKYMSDTIKPTLKDLRGQIEKEDKTDKSSNNTTEGNQ